jgi:uncharacterized cupredoxin-like copper-binding protein
VVAVSPLRWVGALLLAVLAGGCAPTVPASDQVAIAFHYSRFEPSEVRVPAGVPVTITLVNDDPIGHEWIVGTEAVHAVHRSGTDPVHDSRPDEVTVPAYQTRTTTLTFDAPGTYAFICHLPGHEAYGMSGTLSVVPQPARVATR